MEGAQDFTTDTGGWDIAWYADQPAPQREASNRGSSLRVAGDGVTLELSEAISNNPGVIWRFKLSFKGPAVDGTEIWMFNTASPRVFEEGVNGEWDTGLSPAAPHVAFDFQAGVIDLVAADGTQRQLVGLDVPVDTWVELDFGYGGPEEGLTLRYQPAGAAARTVSVPGLVDHAFEHVSVHLVTPEGAHLLLDDMLVNLADPLQAE